MLSAGYRACNSSNVRLIVIVSFLQCMCVGCACTDTEVSNDPACSGPKTRLAVAWVQARVPQTSHPEDPHPQVGAFFHSSSTSGPYIFVCILSSVSLSTQYEPHSTMNPSISHISITIAQFCSQHNLNRNFLSGGWQGRWEADRRTSIGRGGPS